MWEAVSASRALRISLSRSTPGGVPRASFRRRWASSERRLSSGSICLKRRRSCMVRSFPLEEGRAQPAFTSQINATDRAVMVGWCAFQYRKNSPQVHITEKILPSQLGQKQVPPWMAFCFERHLRGVAGPTRPKCMGAFHDPASQSGPRFSGWGRQPVGRFSSGQGLWGHRPEARIRRVVEPSVPAIATTVAGAALTKRKRSGADDLRQSQMRAAQGCRSKERGRQLRRPHLIFLTARPVLVDCGLWPVHLLGI